MKLTIVLVHHHTPDLLLEAVEALTERIAEEAPGSKIVVVDNGSEAGELERIEARVAVVCRPEENLGYAGGINLGVETARADAYLVLNPDVLVLPGCIGELVRTLEEGASVVGPRCAWDDRFRFWMPPSDPRSRPTELLSALASRFGALRRVARFVFRRHAWRHWQAVEPLRSESLTGAVLAFSDRAWQEVGQFDEGFRLYFEETDWLRRARQRGLDLRYVPTAHAVHRYARSTAKEPNAERWFAESAARFRRRHYGRLFTRLLERLARPPIIDAAVEVASGELEILPGCRFIEVSPNPVGFPAVLERIEASDRTWSFPAELVLGWADPLLWVTQCDEKGFELDRRLYRP